MKRFLHKPVLLKLLKRGDDFIFEGDPEKKEWRILATGETSMTITDHRITDSADNNRMVRKLKGY